MQKMKVHRTLFFILFWLFLQTAAAGNADAAGDFYYSIHGASFRDRQQAALSVASFESMGYSSFSEQVDIPGKGMWYRVYVGKYENRDAAKKAANVLKKRSAIDYISINRFLGGKGPAQTGTGKKEKREIAPAVRERTPPPVTPAGKNDRAFDLLKDEKKREKRPDKAPADRSAPPVGRRAEPVPPLAPPVKEPVPPVKEKGAFENKSVAVEPPAPADGIRKGGEQQPAASVLDNAVNAFKAEQYGRAIELIQALLKEGRPDQATLEKGLRLLADCHYAWGSRGDLRLLLTAVDQYKEILQRYPDPAVENDRLYHHLATSYEKLNFFYEASATWERLIIAYPDSPFLPEAMFKVGDVLRFTGKFARMADKLTAYLKKYPDGRFAKSAYFTIADSHYRMQKNDLAGRWFDEARRKWSDLHDIPQAVLFNMANNYFDSARFDDAFQIFSLCASLYPSSDFGKNTLFRAARAADEAGYASLAIKLYGSIMAEYPGDGLADECSLYLANLGVAKPGIKVSGNVTRLDDYRDPLKTYQRLLSKPEGRAEFIEKTMLFKGIALEKRGLTRDAVANYLDMSNRFARGRYRDEVAKRLRNQALNLFKDYQAKEDHLAVADLYFQVKGRLNLADDFDTAFKTGQSLQTIGLYGEARALFTALAEKNKLNRDVSGVLTLAMAHLDLMEKKYGEAEGRLQNVLNEEKNRRKNGNIKQTLADVYFKKGSFEEASKFYADALAGEKIERPSAVYVNYAQSLQNRQMTQAALKSYQNAYKDYQLHPDRYDAALLAELFVGLGEGHYGENRYKEGITMFRQALAHVSDADGKKWLLFKIGQGFARLRDFQEAEKSFAQIKEGQATDFWIKIADLYIADSRRMERSEVRR
jgi:tetratricopeptide (TPR) repeat protein